MAERIVYSVTTNPEYHVVDMLPPDGLISSIGNSERDCIWQLLPEPGEFLRIPDMQLRSDAVQDPVGAVSYDKSLMYVALRGHVRSGALQSLDPEDKNVKAVYKSRKFRMADAVAGHMLGFAVNFNVSLKKFFGNNPGPAHWNYAALLVADFFAGRPAEQPISTMEAIDSAGVPSWAMFKCLERMTDAGYIEYEKDTRQGPMQYGWATDAKIPTAVGNALEQLRLEGAESFSYPDVLAKIDPTSGVGEIALKDILRDLAADGVIRRLSPAAIEPRTKIYCTPSQKLAMDHLSRVYHGLACYDPVTIAEGLRMGRRIMGNGQLVTELLRRCRDESVVVRRPSEEREQWADRVATEATIEYVLRQGELSTADLHTEIGEDLQIPIELLRGFLRSLREQGRVVSRKRKAYMLWRLADAPLSRYLQP